ncbi:sensor histidine kinase [Amycolatopsis magusensis]|uniref:sensor histidine kinase n=1 Tax=Amycolatopsis magusensis TaxID=882444 RepID=UPI003C2BC409
MSIASGSARSSAIGESVGEEPEADRTGKSGQATIWLPDIAPKVANSILVSVLAGIALNATIGIIFQTGTFWPIAISISCVLALVALQLTYVSRPSARKTPRRTAVVLVAQAVLVWAPIFELGPRWHGFTGLLAGSVLVLLPALVAWPTVVLVLGMIVFFELTRGANIVGPVYAVTYIVVSTMITALVIYGLSRLVKLVSDLHAARHELSRMAVAEERLRFSRDVHDLLGLSLSAITLKTELTNRLLTEHPDRARKELEDMLVMSRRALADVRMVASGKRALSLDEECRQAKSALSAAEVEVKIERDDRELDGPVGTVLATVLREGVTNVLRHSDAEWCEISVHEVDGSMRLVIANDGVSVNGSAPAPNAGNGIRNLSHRVSRLGGELTVETEPDGRYRLRADVPLAAAAAH